MEQKSLSLKKKVEYLTFALNYVSIMYTLSGGGWRQFNIYFFSSLHPGTDTLTSGKRVLLYMKEEREAVKLRRRHLHAACVARHPRFYTFLQFIYYVFSLLPTPLAHAEQNTQT